MRAAQINIETKIIDKSPGVRIFYRDAAGVYFNEDSEIEKEEIEQAKNWVLFSLSERKKGT